MCELLNVLGLGMLITALFSVNIYTLTVCNIILLGLLAATNIILVVSASRNLLF